MKKRIITMLNTEWESIIRGLILETFGQINFEMNFSMADRGFAKAWKSQGVVKDREIEFFYKGAEAIFMKTLQRIEDIDITHPKTETDGK